MYNKILTGIVVVLCIAIISMLGYIGYGYVKKFYLNSEAEKFLTEEFDTMVVEVNDEQQEVENNVNEITANTNTSVITSIMLHTNISKAAMRVNKMIDFHCHLPQCFLVFNIIHIAIF